MEPNVLERILQCLFPLLRFLLYGQEISNGLQKSLLPKARGP